MDTPTVSIALATYNGARFLTEQLDSLLAQTRLPDELVVGDDGSVDETVALLESFAERAPFPVRITRNSANLGHARNFAATMRRCSGAIVLPCDQDDIWYRDKIARMTAHLAQNPGAWLATHDAALIDEEGRPLGLTMAAQIAAAGADPAQGLVAGCCMAIDRRLLALFDPEPRLRQHDAWLAEAAGLVGLRSWLPEPLTDYRRHGGNASASYMSASRPASRWLRLRDRASKAMAEPPLVALEAAVASREDVIEALTRHAALLEQAVHAGTVESAVRAQLPLLQRDRRRLAIHTAPPVDRAGKLLGALLAGTYAGRTGVLSLLRDLAGVLRWNNRT